MKKYYRLEYTVKDHQKVWNTPEGLSLSQALNQLIEANKDTDLKFNNVIVVDEKKRSVNKLYL